jgi:peptide/nickel transport system ATP-binding protein
MRPSGCHFHPRCPYVREEHTRVDPRLAPVSGREEHQVACLLPATVRAQIWQGLQAGKPPSELRRAFVEAAPVPAAAAASESGEVSA